MNNTFIKKSILLLVCLFMILPCVTSCSKNIPEYLEIVFPEGSDSWYYCVGDDFDSKQETSEGKINRIPKVYAVFANGKRSKDLSRSKKINFTGYDMYNEGRYTVTAEYRGVKADYEITVLNRQIIFIEAEDPFRSTVGSFTVGEPFTTYYVTEDGVERGVSVWIHYDSELAPMEGYFTNAPELAEAVFDTSACELDENGNFTKAGTFTVRVTLGDYSTGYQIQVKE